jgi:type IV pilus assembly protein PilF
VTWASGSGFVRPRLRQLQPFDDTLDPLRLEFGNPTARATSALVSGCAKAPAGSPSRAARRAAFLRGFSSAAFLLGLSWLTLSCSAAQSPGGGQDDQSRSTAEYDIARDLWINRGQAREALDHALKAIDLDDENPDAAHLAALIYLDFCRQSVDECRLEEAERHARAALDLKPDFREARNTLGVILIHRKEYANAVAVLRPLTEDILYRTPENAWGNMGWAYLEQGALPEAVSALSRSVAAQPDFCVGHYRLGLAEERLGHGEQALAAFTQALNAADGRCQGLQEAYAGRARLLFALHRAEEAERDLQTCVRLDKRTDAGRECLALQGQTHPPPTP